MTSRRAPRPAFASALLAALLAAAPALAAADAPRERGPRGEGVVRPGGSERPATAPATILHRSPGDEPVAELPSRPGRRAPRAEPVALRAAPGRSATSTARGHVVVRFADGVPGWQAEQLVAGLGARALRPARFGAFARVEVAPGDTAEALLGRLRASRSVAWAEADPLVHAAYAGPAAVRAAAAPNDPFFSRQWHFHRIGLEEALARNPSDGAGVVVAVLDSGVAFGDGATFPTRRGVDLEGTSFLPGFDFVDDDDQPFDEGTGDPGEIRFGHGTFTASVIAATIDNGVAGASVAPRVSILPVRVLDTDGFGTFSGVAEGIRFAVARGAKVINMSLGGAGGSTPIAEAVADAARAGVVLVAAAGNEAEDEAFGDELENDVAFPARYPQVLAVGATTFDDSRAAYSNFGPSLDLMAPGGGDNEEVVPGTRDGVLSTSFLFDPRTGEATYGGFWATGTSFASPHVAGAAALLVTLGVDDPAAVRRMLEVTASDLAAPGFDDATAHGLLDAAASHRGIGFTF